LTGKKLSRLAVVVLLLVSTFAVGATSTVAAEETLECDYEFEIFGNVYTLGSCDYEELDFDFQSSAWYSADRLFERWNEDLAREQNQYEATRTFAYRLAESEFAKEMADGSTKTEAQAHADAEVTKYLADTIENRFLQRNNDYVSTLANLHATDGVTVQFGTANWNEIQYANYTVFPDSSESRTFNVSVGHVDDNSDALIFFDIYYNQGGSQNDVNVKFSSDDYSTVGSTSVPTTGFENEIANYEAIRDQVVDEIQTFSDNVNESDFDDLNASDITSPITQATEFGQQYNDTGSTGYACALAASLGESCNVGTEYQNVSYNGENYTGTIYGDHDDLNGSVDTNTTYNGSGKTVWLTTEDGEQVPLDGEFEVGQIELPDGNTTNCHRIRKPEEGIETMENLDEQTEETESQNQKTRGRD